MNQQDFFDRYSFNVREDKIGGGSFGTAYRAYDNTRDREVAIKVSEVREMGGKEFSLRDEFKAIENLPVHANIAHYEDVFTFESPQGVFDYAVMQYYKEGNLSSFLENHPQLSMPEREGVCMAILEGIAHLHVHKVVHRDLKPGNILVVRRKNGAIVPKITDFGLSKQAGTDAKASRFTNSFAGGTLMYSSPEQIRGEKLRLNTDLWSFGAIAFEVLTGKQLFQVDGYSSASAEWQNQMTQRILKEDLEQRIKDLPIKWNNALRACLQRKQEQRVKSTNEIKDLLLGLGDNIGNSNPEPKEEFQNNKKTAVYTEPKRKKETQKKPSTSMVGTRPRAKKEPKWPYALAFVVIAVVAGFGISSFFSDDILDNQSKKEKEISLFQEKGIYGYKMGDSIVIVPKYKLADEFLEGKAKVSTNDSTFYIDQKGRWAKSFINPITTLVEEDDSSLSKDLEKEKMDYDSAVQVNSVVAYQEFLKKYPNSSFKESLESKISSINKKQEQELLQQQKELEAWNTAHYKNTTSSYNSYLDKYPTGTYKQAALKALSTISNKRTKEPTKKINKTEKTLNKIYFKNSTREDVSVLICFWNPDGEWENKGWWTIKPDGSTYVENTTASSVYWYAKDNTGEWIGDLNRNFNGKSYGFKKWNFSATTGKHTKTINNSGKTYFQEEKSSDNNNYVTLNWQLYNSYVIQSFSNGTSIYIQGWVDVFVNGNYKTKLFIGVSADNYGTNKYELIKQNNTKLNNTSYRSVESLQSGFNTLLEKNSISYLD